MWALGKVPVYYKGDIKVAMRGLSKWKTLDAQDSVSHMMFNRYRLPYLK